MNIGWRYRHPYLVNLLGYSEPVNGSFCLIYQLMPQGSLRDRLDCKESSFPLEWDIRLRIAWQVSCALAFLHKPYPGCESLLHLDVKSDNILLDNQNEAKVGDYGLIENLSPSIRSRTYIPPGTEGTLYLSACLSHGPANPTIWHLCRLPLPQIPWLRWNLR